MSAHAEEAEQRNRLTENVEQALRSAGLFRLGVPRAFGGCEAGMATTVGILAELARPCPSSSWIVGTMLGTAEEIYGHALVGSGQQVSFLI